MTMERLVIEPKGKTPLIDFDPESGKMMIRGMSSAENSLEFYRPVLEWLDQYNQKPVAQTSVDIYFKYFNTSSAKCILDLLERFVNLGKSGQNVVINWAFDKNDEEMMEAGENFAEILEFPFEMKEM